jgi:Tol biopolymer transport system component
MPGWGVFGQPHIHPDGTAVVFWGGVSGMPRVWLYETGTQSARALTKIDVGSFEPSFDSSGKRIVFAADVPDAVAPETPTTRTVWQRTFSNLFVMTLDGGALQQITRGNFQDSRPAFSPDGKHVVFLSNRTGNRGGLYVVATDGSTAPRPVINDSGFGRPWFSPDGNYIYAHYYGVAPFVPSEHIRIWRLPVTGGSKEVITPDNLPNSQGGFADYDGVHLWFHSAPRGALRFNLRSGELAPIVAPGFRSIWHVTRSRNGVIAFDSDEVPQESNRR